MSLHIFAFALMVCIYVTLTIFSLFFPHEMIGFQGRFYRRIYKTHLKMSDDEIDSRYQLPTDRYFMGRRSEFIRFAPEDPKRFTRLKLAGRIAGVVMLLFGALLGVGIAFLFVLSAKQVP